MKAHPALNEQYTLYLDPNGYVLGFVQETGSTQYLYVKDSDEELRDWVAKVVLADATSVKATWTMSTRTARTRSRSTG